MEHNSTQTVICFSNDKAKITLSSRGILGTSYS